jgi:hypothetical protein
MAEPLGDLVASVTLPEALSAVVSEALEAAPGDAAVEAPRAAANAWVNMARARAFGSAAAVPLLSSAGLSFAAVVVESVEGAAESSPPSDFASNCRRLIWEAFDASALGLATASPAG